MFALADQLAGYADFEDYLQHVLLRKKRSLNEDSILYLYQNSSPEKMVDARISFRCITLSIVQPSLRTSIRFTTFYKPVAW